MKERENREKEYKLPFEETSDQQIFVFSGFIRQGDKLFFELDYDSPGPKHGTILRSNITDSHTYKMTNYVLWNGEKYQYANQLAQYNESLYDPKQVELWRKRLSLEQISVFSHLIKQMINENGLDNLNGETIFSNEKVIKILGLDQESAFDYTPLKKTSDDQILELA